MKELITCLVAISFVLCSKAQQQPKQENAVAQFLPIENQDANTKLTYKIIDALNHTYGYDVLADSRLIIHQKSIPGNEGFKTKADAEKVAQ